jgi:guanosine-3',5'-bis(diphosphate) 3'-pyrophosphohydrolase
MEAIVLSRYRSLLRSMEGKADAKDKELVKRAFDLANDAHKNVKRKSGDPYIVHPLEVALVVAKEIGLGPTSIAAALLHDVVEDSDYTLEEIDRLFGPTVARLVDGLTKIAGVFDQDTSLQAENFRKMLISISDDVRVILIKMADRLNNMRTLDAMPAHKQLKIASETLFIFAPLAHRMGLYAFKTEFEDLALKYTEPETFEEIREKLDERKENDLKYLRRFAHRVKDLIKNQGVEVSIKERTKSIYSIRRKMVNQGIRFEEVYDKYAIRIILNTPREKEKEVCWQVYSLITSQFRPNPRRLRDWITTPKSNGYESLHTTVMGPEGHWIEVQIRTERMDDMAEKGYAAHWKYKEDISSNTQLDAWVDQVRLVLENQDENAIDFVDNFKLQLVNEEIMVFTPQGEIRRLPKGATALDFAYDIHTNLGHHTLGAKVNGKLVALDFGLSSGDQIEVISTDKQQPQEAWLQWVVTPRALAAIRQALRDRHQKAATSGKTTLDRMLKAAKVEPTQSTIQLMLNFFGLRTPSELHLRIGQGTIKAEQIRNFLRQESGGFYNYLRKRFSRSQKSQLVYDKSLQADEISSNTLVFGPDELLLEHTLATCCRPIPGDEVFGYFHAADGIVVHRTDCAKVVAIQSRFAQRTIVAKWKNADNRRFTAYLRLQGMDTQGLIHNVTRIISNDLRIDIRSMSITGDHGVFNGDLVVSVEDKGHLNNLIRKLKDVRGVDKVERLNSPGKSL